MDNHSLRSQKDEGHRGYAHRSTIWREDSVSCNLLSQFSRTPSRPSRRSSMSEEWARNEHFRPPNDNKTESKAQRIGLNPHVLL